MPSLEPDWEDPVMQRAYELGRASLRRNSIESGDGNDTDATYQYGYVDLVTYLYSDDDVIADMFKNSDSVAMAAEKKALSILILTMPATPYVFLPDYEADFGRAAKEAIEEMALYDASYKSLEECSDLLQKCIAIEQAYTSDMLGVQPIDPNDIPNDEAVEKMVETMRPLYDEWLADKNKNETPEGLLEGIKRRTDDAKLRANPATGSFTRAARPHPTLSEQEMQRILVAAPRPTGSKPN